MDRLKRIPGTCKQGKQIKIMPVDDDRTYIMVGGRHMEAVAKLIVHRANKFDNLGWALGNLVDFMDSMGLSRTPRGIEYSVVYSARSALKTGKIEMLKRRKNL